MDNPGELWGGDISVESIYSSDGVRWKGGGQMMTL